MEGFYSPGCCWGNSVGRHRDGGGESRKMIYQCDPWRYKTGTQSVVTIGRRYATAQFEFDRTDMMSRAALRMAYMGMLAGCRNSSKSTKSTLDINIVGTVDELDMAARAEGDTRFCFTIHLRL